MIIEVLETEEIGESEKNKTFQCEFKTCNARVDKLYKVRYGNQRLRTVWICIYCLKKLRDREKRRQLKEKKNTLQWKLFE